MPPHDEPALILIVDDTPANLDVLANALGAAGMTIAVACDGEMALEQVAIDPPALILLDVRLPGIDGFETCRRLKANPATAEIPVIFMTALVDTVDKVRGFEVGAVDYIAKPFQQEELLARIHLHLRLRRLSDALLTLTNELEQRVASRTSELAERTVELATRSAELESTLAKLQASQQALEVSRHELQNEVAQRTEELRIANQQLEAELALQRSRFEELSTPLIPIADKVVVMPLIGTVEKERAEQVLQTALQGVAEQRAHTVIVDITGVKRINAGVAETLLRMATALRLLGAQTILTGMRSEVAQDFVEIGLDLGSVLTLGTLKSGIAHALGLRPHNITRPRRAPR